MSYHERRFMAFRANDQCYGHIHCIVSSNDLILRTNVHLETTNNVAEESFYFPCIKIFFFHFRSAKNEFFCEAHTKNMLQNGSTTFFKIIRPHFMYK